MVWEALQGTIGRGGAILPFTLRDKAVGSSLGLFNRVLGHGYGGVRPHSRR